MHKIYKKGYRAERLASQYMHEKYGCSCMESRGSHGVADLLCGNGTDIYAIQVKSGGTLPNVNFLDLNVFARCFKAIPLVLYKPDYNPFIEIRNADELKAIRGRLKDR